MSQSSMSELQLKMVTVMQQQKLQQQHQDDKHEYVNTETDNNIESKESHSYDIDKQYSKQLLDANNVGSKSFQSTRFKKQQIFFLKTE